MNRVLGGYHHLLEDMNENAIPAQRIPSGEIVMTTNMADLTIDVMVDEMMTTTHTEEIIATAVDLHPQSGPTLADIDAETWIAAGREIQIETESAVIGGEKMIVIDEEIESTGAAADQDITEGGPTQNLEAVPHAEIEAPNRIVAAIIITLLDGHQNRTDSRQNIHGMTKIADHPESRVVWILMT